jgi:ribosomal protein L5
VRRFIDSGGMDVFNYYNRKNDQHGLTILKQFGLPFKD